MLELSVGDAWLVVLPEDGGRLASFSVGDLELLRTPDDDPGGTHWGAFVMAPWAGRTRDGRFTFGGVEHQLARNSGAHAIHGTVRDRPWTVESSDERSVRLSCDLGPGWPYAGHVEHDIALDDDHADFTLSIHTDDDPMPAVGGWHPWWRRQLDRGTEVRLDLPAGAMLRRDGEGIATEDRASPIPPGPWDDCFTDLRGAPVLCWPGAIELAIESDCPYVVVYDEPVDSICVEPQSGPPDSLNRHPDVAEPGHPVVVHSTWRWRALDR